MVCTSTDIMIIFSCLTRTVSVHIDGSFYTVVTVMSTGTGQLLTN